MQAGITLHGQAGITLHPISMTSLPYLPMGVATHPPLSSMASMGAWECKSMGVATHPPLSSMARVMLASPHQRTPNSISKPLEASSFTQMPGLRWWRRAVPQTEMAGW